MFPLVVLRQVLGTSPKSQGPDADLSFQGIVPENASRTRQFPAASTAHIPVSPCRRQPCREDFVGPRPGCKKGVSP